MSLLIAISGVLIILLGFTAEHRISDPAIFQGALTLGGGFLICALFTRYSRSHGVIGAGVLALLGATRSALSLMDLIGNNAQALPYQVLAFVVCLVVLIPVVRWLLAERARRQLDSIEAAERRG